MAITKQPKMPVAGPVGRQLIANLRELLEARGLSFRRASAALDELGRPIPPLGMSRLLDADRRVDVDELVALAVMLGVNPSALLLPRHAGRDDIVDLTPKTQQRSHVVWGWADGRFPLPPELAEAEAIAVHTPGDRFVDFQVHARPETGAAQSDPAVFAAIVLARMLENVLADPGGVDTWRAWRDNIVRQLRQIALNLEGLIEQQDRMVKAKAGFEFDSAGAIRQIREAVGDVREPTLFQPGVQMSGHGTLDAGRPDTGGPHGAATTVNPLDPFGKREP